MTHHPLTNRFRLAHGNGGFRIVPEPDSDTSLILRLFDQGALEAQRPLPGSLVQVVGELMVTASRRGLELQPKEQLTNPLLVLTEVQYLRPLPGVQSPFAGLQGKYAAHWGLTDFYDPHAAALRAALQTKEPLDTGVFGSKKEIHHARLRRDEPGGSLLFWVKCEADDGIALADTAFWRAAGGNEHCESGEDALRRAGVRTADIRGELSSLAALGGVGEENSATRECELPPDADFDAVCSALDTLAEAAEEELDTRSQRMAELAKERLQELRLAKGG